MWRKRADKGGKKSRRKIILCEHPQRRDSTIPLGVMEAKGSRGDLSLGICRGYGPSEAAAAALLETFFVGFSANEGYRGERGLTWVCSNYCEVVHEPCRRGRRRREAFVLPFSFFFLHSCLFEGGKKDFASFFSFFLFFFFGLTPTLTLRPSKIAQGGGGQPFWRARGCAGRKRWGRWSRWGWTPSATEVQARVWCPFLPKSEAVQDVARGGRRLPAP